MNEILSTISSIEWIALGILVFVKLRKMHKQANELLAEMKREAWEDEK